MLHVEFTYTGKPVYDDGILVNAASVGQFNQLLADRLYITELFRGKITGEN